ncbi:hypothetical protein RUND412_010653 [Rhizina undulata]
MSDTGRKSMTEQLGDKMKLDSQKPATEQASDTVSGWYDRAAGMVQPESQKSTTQHMGDKARGGADSGSQQAKGMTESMSDMAANAAQSVKDTMSSMTGGGGSKK